MTLRILIAECKQEVSTFNPNLSHLGDFGIRRREDLIDYHRTVRNEVGGALSVFDQDPQVELLPTYSAFFITSGGTLAADAWSTLSKDFLDEIRAVAQTGPIDGVYFCMHGAMCAENEFDPEGFLLEQAREILGEKIPMVVSLDLHGIATRKMFQQADAIVAYHTYPHVDFFETGSRAAELLLRIVRQEVRPVTARVVIPALVRGDELITETGLFGRCIRAAQNCEKGPRGLSAGMFIGNPFTDVPELGSVSFVVTNDDEPLACETAMKIAEEFWSYRERMQVPLLSLEELQKAVLEIHRVKPPTIRSTIGLVDAADATSSGASGDSSAVIKALLECGYPDRVLAPIVDRPAAEIAFRAGVGGLVKVQVGGALDPNRFQPMTIEGKVRSLSDGVFRSESFGELWDSGPTAVIESNRLTLVVSSRGVNLYDRSFYFANGQNPRNFDAVVIKSPHCQHAMYAAWCSHMLLIDAPGSSSANLPRLGHRRCARPVFPLDHQVEFQPVVEVYRRNTRS
jgi:microcystin degradation protein MlrC